VEVIDLVAFGLDANESTQLVEDNRCIWGEHDGLTDGFGARADAVDGACYGISM
jgi:hypothetical protein